MSEEQAQQQAFENARKVFILTILTGISLIFSIVALGLSAIPLVNGGLNVGGEAKKVVISKQYDKGKSLQKAQDTNKPIIVFFYTDWCGFCQRFVPTFDKISKKPEIKKNFAIAYVNCEKEENQKIVEEYGIQGFPTVIVIDEQGKRTPLENNTLFIDDAKDVVAKKALEIIGKE